MPITDNERIQEIAMVTGDTFSSVRKKFWIAQLVALVAIFPIYFGIKYGGAALLNINYAPPEIIREEVVKQPLQVLEKKIFRLTGNVYSGYVRVKNIEQEWGVPKQEFVAEFKTYGGTVITKVNGTAFILPSSEKIIVFSRFTADQKPDELSFTLMDTHFIRKTKQNFDFSLERVSIQNSPTGMVVSAGITNETAFTVNRIHLPVIVYNNQNQVVGVNYYFINDVLPGETRTFQYTWPMGIDGAIRAEIHPEINLFDPDLFQLREGVSPINDR